MDLSEEGFRMLSPHRLKRGDTVGVFVCGSSAKACHPEAFRLYRERLSSLGLRVIEADNFLESHAGNRAGSPSRRAEVFTAMIKNPNIQGLLSFWGGNHTNEVLPFLDFAAIRDARKPIIGYSDTTCLQLAILTRSRLVTYTGPAGITFGKDHCSERTIDSFVEMCFEDASKPSQSVSIPFQASWQVFQNGRAEGSLLGGNLSVMMLLSGTRFWPDFRGGVLYLEMSEDQDYEQFENQLYQLDCMRVFENISGLLFGRFATPLDYNPRLFSFLSSLSSLRDKPILSHFDCGHADPVLTLPIGGKMEMHLREDRFLLIHPS